jgi:hypothetical protein
MTAQGTTHTFASGTRRMAGTKDRFCEKLTETALDVRRMFAF